MAHLYLSQHEQVNKKTQAFELEALFNTSESWNYRNGRQEAESVLVYKASMARKQSSDQLGRHTRLRYTRRE